jgi:uncharacterized protein YdiU (UPF0061 family)
MHTPNHDDHQLRYSYRLQPTIIWWNLTRLGEALGELMGSMSHVDDPIYVSGEYTEEQKAEVVKHGERIIEAAGEEFKAVFLQEYKQLMQKVPILSFRPVLYLMLWTVTYSSVLDYKPLKRMIWNYFQRH